MNKNLLMGGSGTYGVVTFEIVSDMAKTLRERL